MRVINTKGAKAFLAGMVMAMVCQVLQPLTNRGDYILQIFVLEVLALVGALVMAETVLKRFGFEGFDWKISRGKQQILPYFLFFAGFMTPIVCGAVTTVLFFS